MIINRSNMDLLFNAFNAAYLSGFGEFQAASEYDAITHTVTSTTAEETYSWLGDLNGMVEWLGDRQVDNFRQHDFRIKNKDFEKTVEVDRNSIEDDRYGVYSMRFSLLGQAVARHPNELVFPLLKKGHTTECYDGQFFFDTDHPAGNGTASNRHGNGDPLWYIMDLSTMFRPIIFQRRKQADVLIRLDREDDPNVFMRKKFIYGTDCRDNVGFGFWQLAAASSEPLTQANFVKAYEAMSGIKGDAGQPLGIKATHLIHPPSLKAEATMLMENDRDANGATNTVKGWCMPMEMRWLA